MIRRITAVCAILIVLLGASACGYRLAGTSDIIPEHIRTIAVLPFDNRTERPEIEQRVTEEVTRELSKRGQFRVITDGAVADAILEGAITSYKTAPVQFSSEVRATRQEAVVTIRATLREGSNDEILWSQNGLIFREQFDVPEEGEFFDQETLALDDIARGAAGALVTSIFEGF